MKQTTSYRKIPTKQFTLTTKTKPIAQKEYSLISPQFNLGYFFFDD